MTGISALPPAHALISVIIPTFNRYSTLGRAVNSVLSQEDVSLELIIVDDGSTDKTCQYLKTIAQRPDVIVISQENKGVSAARNRGVRHSKGQYICFLDSDDEWLPGKLKAQVEFLEQEAFKIVQTSEIWVRRGVRVNMPVYCRKAQGDIFSLCLERCMITPSSVMMTRSLFDEFEGFDEAFYTCEDYELWLRITSRYHVGLISRDYLKRYGGHDDQLSAKYPAMDKYRIRAVAKLVRQGVLTLGQRNFAVGLLKKKLAVYEKGCRKRHKLADIEWCEALRQEFSQN